MEGPVPADVGAGFFVATRARAAGEPFVGASGSGYRVTVRQAAARRNYQAHETGRFRPGKVDMSTMTPRERATIVKRVRELDAKLQDPRAPMNRINDLHKEREGLSKRLREDARRVARAPSPQPSAAAPPASRA